MTRTRRRLIGLVPWLLLMIATPAFAQPGFLAAHNSSTTAIGSNGVFTGTADEVLPFKNVTVFVFSDQASAASGLSLQFSTDGTNWDLTYPYTVSASTTKTVSLPVVARYFRVVYTNSSSAQGIFRLQTMYFATAEVPPLGLRKDTNVQSTATDGEYSAFAVDAYGALFARSDHPNRISCVVAVSTATTIQAVGGSCVAPGAGLSLYITDIEFGTSAAAGTAADSFPTLKTGTGGTCGSNTAVVWQALTAANTTVVANYTTPLKLPANSELCWIMSTAGSKTLQVHGFIAP